MKRTSVLFLVLLLIACKGPDPEARLVLEDAWVRAMPPGSGMTAGFGRLANVGGGEAVISGWASEDFGKVSLHRTVNEDGVSRMRAVPELRLPAGSELILEPGGYHLMFMRPADRERPNVRLRVELADGRQFDFELPVERR
jgi:copper(I)-binding protein